ncbi:MAG TPA: hypothetical protein VLV82_02615 [Candidatus Angelobacter sp.]|nr:hypothetical protein [Candidatus Angelobacter sp.]
MFTELSLDPPTTAPISAYEPVDDVPATTQPPSGGYGYDSEPRVVEPELEPAFAGGTAHPEGADMAALLRELSSLGGAFDTEPGSGTGSGTVVTRPVQSVAPEKSGKKKKGFFGR